MSQTDLPSAGTTAPVVADPASPGTTTPAAADGAQQPSAETPEQRIAAAEARAAEADRKFQELLRMKGNAEDVSRENERLRAQLTPPTTGATETAQYAARLQRAQMILQQQAAGDPANGVPGDDTALALLAIMGAVQQQPQQLMQRIDLLEVPKDERADVERKQREAWDRGERISATTAKQLLEAEALSKRAAAIAAKEDELRKAAELKARGVVQTSTVSVPASEINQESMTFSQFARAWDNATPEQRIELRKRERNLKPD